MEVQKDVHDLSTLPLHLAKASISRTIFKGEQQMDEILFLHASCQQRYINTHTPKNNKNTLFLSFT